MLFHILNTTNHKFEIQERRRQIAKFIARGNMTQEQMAQALGVDQTTISGDIEALKKASQRFIYDLAKSDLAYYYKSFIVGIADAKAEAWTIYSNSQQQDLSAKDKLALMQLVINAIVELFKLVSQGPNILAFKAQEERLAYVESIAATNTRATV